MIVLPLLYYISNTTEYRYPDFIWSKNMTYSHIKGFYFSQNSGGYWYSMQHTHTPDKNNYILVVQFKTLTLVIRTITFSILPLTLIVTNLLIAANFSHHLKKCKLTQIHLYNSEKKCGTSYGGYVHYFVAWSQFDFDILLPCLTPLHLYLTTMDMKCSNKVPSPLKLINVIR